MFYTFILNQASSVTIFCDPKTYLENKHFSSEHSNCVKVPFTDIWSIVVWSFSGPGAIRVPGRVLRWPGLWATGCHCGQGLCGTTISLTFRE